MTASISGEADLRHWLVNYLVANCGCAPDEVDPNLSLADLGVSSRDVVVLSGELTELLGKSVSPIEFWEHPTISALAAYLTAPEGNPESDPSLKRSERNSLDAQIAVIGIGCRFPGGISGPEVLWQFLCERRSSIGEVPPERWELFDDGSPEVKALLAHTTRWGSFLPDIDAFDAKFFEISPSEAAKMDPQQRLLLEVAWEALEHAGIPPSSLRRSQTGVFAGACTSEYGAISSSDLCQIDGWTNTGGASSIIANRLSYFLDLRGPSMSVDTACSSSLVAIHLACQSLRTQDSQLAIAAGVNLLLSPSVFRGFDEVGALSPTGQCRAFDAAADGFVRGEGAGVVVLKRLTDAQSDGDRVLAVIRGSAVNQDGRSNGLMAPNPAAQKAVLHAAYTNAGLQPHEVDYVEAHGAGTLLGDPIEARALGTVLGRGRPEGSPLLVGAVKTNLGHTEAAAGIAGFIKTVLAVQRGQIPPNQRFESPNPHIPFADLRMKVVDTKTNWPATGHPRRAGVSSFGFGGTNAHVVIEQGQNVTPPPARDPEPAVSTLVVAGKTPQRVATTASVLADWMEGAGADVPLADVAHTLNHHRARQAKFGTVVARDRAHAVAGLRALADGQRASGVVRPDEGATGPGTVFVYSGCGTQWSGMGRRLLADEPAFASAVAELEPVFVEQAGFSLHGVIADGKVLVSFEQIQLGLMGMQLALTMLWRSYGVNPDVVIGHSTGEVAAAVVAGALTPTEGLRVTATRSRLMAPLSGKGSMALLELDTVATSTLISDYPQVALGIYNSPRQTVIAGPTEQIEALIAKVRAHDRMANRVNIEMAPHNPAVDPMQSQMRSELADLTPRQPSIPIISTTYEDVGTHPAFDAEHWAINMRNPVHFQQAITAAGTDHHTFIEVSGDPLLTHAVLDTLHSTQPGSKYASVGTLQRYADDTITFRTNLNTVRTAHPPQTPHPPEPHAQIPTTPWQHTHHWITTRQRANSLGPAPKAGSLPDLAPQAKLVPEAQSEKPTLLTYRLPNDTVPVLLSADTPELLHAEAAAVLSYAADRPEITPQAIAAMLFRTRLARKYRALAMVTNRDQLLSALQAAVDGHKHPAVIRNDTPAMARRVAYVFPGQGNQRPGMGRHFYESVPAFRAEADRCAEAFQTRFGASPLHYLLDEDLPAEDSAGTVQPALFTQMAGLAAMWRSFGVAPTTTVGHSQGEIAAAYISGRMTLADAVRVVGIRAHAVDEIASGDYAMAIVATDRDTCENALARTSGWVELSVINSPNMTGISGDREAVQDIVDTFIELGTFARVIGVSYPAHTSLIHELAQKVRATTQRELQNAKFLDTEIDCLGATLGGPITGDLPVDKYWFWNLRNAVRFDKAMAATLPLGIDTFVELAEHPTLQLAVQENLAVLPGERPTIVVGTSQRTATNLDEFTHNLAQLAVHDLDYSWACLSTESDGTVSLPLPDFPNTATNENRPQLPDDGALRGRAHHTPTVKPVAAAGESAHDPIPETAPARLLVEEWVRLSQRSLVPPRAIGIVDHTGACTDVATALCAAAGEMDTTARAINIESNGARGDLNTLVILVPQSPKLDAPAAAEQVAEFFGNRRWWPDLDDAITECWLITVNGESVVADDAPPDPVHAAASAGFRSIGAEYLGVGFRHLDLPATSTTSESANAILAALHTKEESELAFRDGGLYAKRLVESDISVADSLQGPLEHVLVIGGTGNLGLEFCSYFAHRGARRITLVSRSGENAAIADRLQQIRSATSTQIQVTKCDVSDPAAVSRLAEQHQGAPADLIIHAALEYSEIELKDITTEKVEQALRAKAVGISHVLEAFSRTDNCHTVLCSSVAATIGGHGQAVYAAANRMLDAMAHRLRADGLDCVSVQWSQWTVHFDTGASGKAKLAGIGIVPMCPADALALGMRQLRRNVIVAAFDLARARSVLTTLGYGPLVSKLTSPVVDARALVQEISLPQRFVELLAEAIGADSADAIDTTVPMVALGLDSLQALEFRRRVQIEFNHDLNFADILGGASVADVLAQLSG